MMIYSVKYEKNQSACLFILLTTFQRRYSVLAVEMLSYRPQSTAKQAEAPSTK